MKLILVRMKGVVKNFQNPLTPPGCSLNLVWSLGRRKSKTYSP